MKKLTHVLAVIVGGAAAVLQVPAVQQAILPLVAGNPGATAAVLAVGAIAALYHNPKPPSEVPNVQAK